MTLSIIFQSLLSGRELPWLLLQAPKVILNPAMVSLRATIYSKTSKI